VSTPKLTAQEFYIPARPYSPIDAHNRRAAAMGSPRYAELTAYADYNGHHVTLGWNSYRNYYVAEYFWAGRVVIGRGSFSECLRATVDEYKRGALGASATVRLREDDTEALALAEAESLLVRGSFWVSEGHGSSKPREESWWTWRHTAASEGARDMANPRCSVLIFDWPLMEAAESREEYERAVETKYGRVYA
jgi:hypothetical protein